MSSEFYQGLLWLLIGVAVTFFSRKYSMGTLSEPGPGVLPFGLGLVLILLSVLLLFRSRRHREMSQDKRLPFGSRYGRVLWVILLLGAGTFCLETLGYLLLLFLLIAGAMVIVEPRRWVSALMLGVASSILSYVLFNIWLKVPLPRGWIHF